MDRPLASDLRRLQQYVVAIPQKEHRLWLAAGLIRPIHPALGDELPRFEDLSLYDSAVGVRLDAPFERNAGENIIS
jgi:CRISPR-associated endonuclease/helicase Cas3